MVYCLLEHLENQVGRQITMGDNFSDNGSNIIKKSFDSSGDGSFTEDQRKAFARNLIKQCDHIIDVNRLQISYNSIRCLAAVDYLDAPAYVDVGDMVGLTSTSTRVALGPFLKKFRKGRHNILPGSGLLEIEQDLDDMRYINCHISKKGRKFLDDLYEIMGNASEIIDKK